MRALLVGSIASTRHLLALALALALVLAFVSVRARPGAPWKFGSITSPMNHDLSLLPHQSRPGCPHPAILRDCRGTAGLRTQAAGAENCGSMGALRDNYSSADAGASALEACVKVRSSLLSCCYCCCCPAFLALPPCSRAQDERLHDSVVAARRRKTENAETKEVESRGDGGPIALPSPSARRSEDAHAELPPSHPPRLGPSRVVLHRLGGDLPSRARLVVDSVDVRVSSEWESPLYVCGCGSAEQRACGGRGDGGRRRPSVRLSDIVDSRGSLSHNVTRWMDVLPCVHLRDFRAPWHRSTAPRAVSAKSRFSTSGAGGWTRRGTSGTVNTSSLSRGTRVVSSLRLPRPLPACRWSPGLGGVLQSWVYA